MPSSATNNKKNATQEEPRIPNEGYSTAMYELRTTTLCDNTLTHATTLITDRKDISRESNLVTMVTQPTPTMEKEGTDLEICKVCTNQMVVKT